MAAAILAVPQLALADEPAATVHVTGHVTGGWCDRPNFLTTVTFAGPTSSAWVPVGQDINGPYADRTEYRIDAPADSTSVTVKCVPTLGTIPFGYRITNTGLVLVADTALDLVVPAGESTMTFEVTDGGVPYTGHLFMSEECLTPAEYVLAPGLNPGGGCQQPFLSAITAGHASLTGFPSPRLPEVIVGSPSYAAVAYVRDLEVVADKTIPIEIGTPADPVVVEPPTPPPGVDDAAASAASSRELVWSPPTDDGGIAVTGYRVTVEGRPGETPVTGRSIAVTGLTPGVPATARIRAANPVGPSTSSTAVTFVPGTPDEPGTVTAVRGDASLAISWSAASTAADAPLTRYVVHVNDDSSRRLPADRQATQLACTVTGLANGRTYRARVRAVNGVGPGPESTLTHAVVPAGVPGPPRSLRALSTSARTTVTWLAAVPNGRPVTRYWIRLSANRGLRWTKWASVGTARTATLRGLVRGRTYAVQVRASNAVGLGVIGSVGVRPR